MADVIRVNTDLLERCANELRQASHGFGEAASILSGLNVSEEWWDKIGGFTAISLQDEGSSASMGTAGASVTSLANVMRRYDGRLSKLAGSATRAASLFSATEGSLLARANGQGAGRDGVINPPGAGGVVGGAAGAAVEDEDAAKQQRQEQAKWLKIGAGVLCAVGSIAVVVATGGAALPVIAAGVAAGAVTAGVNNAADQYAEKGWDDIDWSDAGKDAVIGGIVGGVTSAISIGGAAVTQQVAGRVTGQVAAYATTATGKIVTHVAGGVVSSVAAGTASRAGGEAVNQYLREGTVDWNRVRDRAFDPRQMAVDGIMGGTTGYFRGRRYTSNGQYVRNESYLKSNGDVDWSQAPNNGIDSTKPVNYDYEIPTGTELRRSGSEYGGFLRNESDSFNSAALPYEYNPFAEHRYEVIKPISGVTKSTAAPAFDMPGGATQYQLPDGVNVRELVKQGFLRRIY